MFVENVLRRRIIYDDNVYASGISYFATLLEGAHDRNTNQFVWKDLNIHQTKVTAAETVVW